MADQECRGSLVDCNYREMPVRLSPFFFPTCGTALVHVSNPVRAATDGGKLHQAMWYQKAQGCHCY